MTAKTLALSSALALAILMGPIEAQSATPAGPAPTLTYGPALNGVCVVSTGEVLGTSAVGKSVQQRMDMLSTQVNAELQPQAQALATEQRALQQAANPDAARVSAFNQKATDFQKLRDERVQELDATKQKQVRRMLVELQPVIQQIFQQKQCSILLERDNGVLAVNPAMDLTPAAVAGLNGRIQTLTFDREPLPAQSGGAAPQ